MALKANRENHALIKHVAYFVPYSSSLSSPPLEQGNFAQRRVNKIENSITVSLFNYLYLGVRTRVREKKHSAIISCMAALFSFLFLCWSFSRAWVCAAKGRRRRRDKWKRNSNRRYQHPSSLLSRDGLTLSIGYRSTANRLVLSVAFKVYSMQRA